MKVVLILLGLVVTPFALPESRAQTLKPLDHGLTPLERSAFEAGVFAAHDFTKCSIRARVEKVNLPDLIPAEQNIPIGLRAIPASKLNVGLVDTIQKAIQLFVDMRNDRDLRTKNLCVGLYNFGEINAFSHVDGYLFFDPSLLDHFLAGFNDRTMLSLDMVVYHELAHQFEFWYGDAFENDATYKRSELTADCVAAYINAALYRFRFGEEGWNLSKKGILKAVESIGDFQYENRNHHGTPAERYKSAQLGIEIAESRLSPFMTSRQVLNACQAQVAGSFR
jgi:hypothetical protein